MTANTTSQRTPFRAFLIAGGLLLSGIFAANSATATTLIPAVDMGGPGGGGGQASLVAPYAGSANQRSVQLTESREATTQAVTYIPPAASKPSGFDF